MVSANLSSTKCCGLNSLSRALRATISCTTFTRACLRWLLVLPVLLLPLLVVFCSDCLEPVKPLPPSPSTYTANWSLGIQRELPGKILIDSTYVGNHGVQLVSSGEAIVNLNQLTPEQVSQGASLLNQVPNPFFGQITVGTLAAK